MQLDFFSSYLENRRQYVEYRGYKSFDVLATSGVPQGSVLGPLMFVVFINDIVANLNVESLLYADDLKIYCVIENEQDCENLQNNLNKVNDWCLSNNLPLNISKCNSFTFSKMHKPIDYNYHINGQILQRPDTVKDLGVIFDKCLSFKDHINLTIASALKSLGFIISNS